MEYRRTVRQLPLRNTVQRPRPHGVDAAQYARNPKVRYRVVRFFFLCTPRPSGTFLLFCQTRGLSDNAAVAREWKTKINKKKPPARQRSDLFYHKIHVRPNAASDATVMTTRVGRESVTLSVRHQRGLLPCQKHIKSRSTFYNIDEIQVSVQLCNYSVFHKTVSEKTPLQHAR